MNEAATQTKPVANPLVGNVVLPDVQEDTGGLRRDFIDESMFGIDDNVVLMNILDGTVRNGLEMPRMEYVFDYNGQRFKVQPGQKFNLPGARAYLYVKHLVSLIYRRVENKPEMDKRTYPLSDRWVKEMVVDVQHVLRSADEQERGVVQDLPDYMQKDDRLMNAAGGTGEVELKRVDMREQAATDEDIDKTPDFDPATAPQFKDEEGNVIETSAQQVPDDSGNEFPDAKPKRGRAARQADK